MGFLHGPQSWVVILALSGTVNRTCSCYQPCPAHPVSEDTAPVCAVVTLSSWFVIPCGAALLLLLPNNKNHMLKPWTSTDANEWERGFAACLPTLSSAKTAAADQRQGQLAGEQLCWKGPGDPSRQQAKHEPIACPCITEGKRWPRLNQ